ncbi:unnamed protein product [Closterium sp. NIES-65]|nr:unnamed protein product [Closterium sp. NIES-65]
MCVHLSSLPSLFSFISLLPFSLDSPSLLLSLLHFPFFILSLPSFCWCKSRWCVFAGARRAPRSASCALSASAAAKKGTSMSAELGVLLLRKGI